MNKVCQVGPVFGSSTCNHQQLELASKSVNHREGGWPKEIDARDSDQVARFLKKIEKDENYLDTILSVASLMEEKVQQNNAIELYGDYFTELDESTRTDNYKVNTLAVFKDTLDFSSRPVSDISWSPDGGSRIAVSYCSRDYRIPSDICEVSDALLFNVDDPTKFELALSASVPVTSIAFSRTPFIIAGGLYNGQVCVWDVRVGSHVQNIVPVPFSHTEPVYGLVWTNVKSGKELQTCSPDGTIKWWDIRNLDKPTETLILDIENKDTRSPGDIDAALEGSVLEYEHTIPAKYMVATSQGVILNCSKKARSQPEVFGKRYSAHTGDIVALQRCKIFPKNFLTVGDYTAKIWSEDIDESPLISLNCGIEKPTGIY
ncbi:dynein intermediate chain 3, ciliary [Eurytemora carolleeae]|uniref:dynein intermediate chain 3, ciliary n=1 Tax=Eurytemora carolleeae TaxID=1294199 RepID=UPI000C780BCD|nr:dynein intermediate chain 3, ciliary [Eurytemora carolleeae]|eukprot:XP_023324346.1 dynein intermediate chain 3, ciliary-like [Eurytemora affinis]